MQRACVLDTPGVFVRSFRKGGANDMRGLSYRRGRSNLHSYLSRGSFEGGGKGREREIAWSKERSTMMSLYWLTLMSGMERLNRLGAGRKRGKFCKIAGYQEPLLCMCRHFVSWCVTKATSGPS